MGIPTPVYEDDNGQFIMVPCNQKWYKAYLNEDDFE